MTDSHFVADGQERAIHGAFEQIAERCAQTQADIEAEYAKQLAEAGFLKRMILNFRMEREIKRRIASEMETIAPDGALYWKC